jgi:hypothetical protein
MANPLRAFLRYSARALLFSNFLGSLAFAQQSTLAALNEELAAPAPLVSTATAARTFEPHKFWDKENGILFASNAALAGADFAVTRTNLQSGGRELNPLMRPFSHSTGGLAANFAGETAAVIGLSYFFHRAGHHRLERITSIVNISASGFAVTYGLNHR